MNRLWRVEQNCRNNGWLCCERFYLGEDNDWDNTQPWRNYAGCDDVSHPAIDLSRNEAIELASRLARHCSSTGTWRFRVRSYGDPYIDIGLI